MVAAWKKNQYFRPIFSSATDGKMISNSIFDKNRFHKAPKIEYPFIFTKVYVNRLIRSSCRAPHAPNNTVFRKTHSKFEVTRLRGNRRFRSTGCDFKNILYMKISFYPRVFNILRMLILQETKNRFFHRQVLQHPLKRFILLELKIYKQTAEFALWYFAYRKII